MKKLMIAMGAAAMMSLCAQAAVPQAGADTAYGKSLGTGTDFENYNGDFDIEADDFGGDTYARYWAQRAAGVTGDSALFTTNNNTYLKVDETEELTRLIDVDQGAVAPKTVVGQGGLSVYFSSKVQFTAADDAPVPAANIDKIIVWAKAPDEEPGGTTTTNLMVTALDLSGSDNDQSPDYNENYGKPKAYDTGVTITADQWYTLDIVAAAQSGDSPIAFTVSLDGVSVGGTYNSMVTSGEARGTISSASFKGTGAVDDIDWGTVAAAPDVTVTVTCTDGYTVYTSEAATPDVAYSTPIVVKAGASVTVYVGDDYGTLNVTSSVGTVGKYDVDNAVWPVTYTTDAQTLAVTLAITVEPDDGKTPITENDVTLSYEQATYREGIDYPTVTVTVNNVELTVGTDYTVSWVPDTITAAGGEFTVTVAGTGNYKGSVVKTITITPAGGDKAKVGDTEYASGADFVAAATSGTVNTLPSGWTVDGNVVKDGTGATFATFPAFYTLALNEGTLTLTLNDAALDTVSEMTAVTVGETFGLSVSASNAKLYYGLSSSTTVTGTYTKPTALTRGTGSALTIPAAKSGTQCFYKLYVTDIAPAPAQD